MSADQALRDLQRRAAEGDLAARDRLAMEQVRRGRDEQQEALDLMLSGANVFLTGPGGTGKSYVIHRFLEECRKIRKRVIPCATTGVAAVALGGTTLHRAVGIPVDRVRSRGEVKTLPAPWDEDPAPTQAHGQMVADVAQNLSATIPGTEDFERAAEESRVKHSLLCVQSYKASWREWTARRLRFGFRPDRRDDSSVGPGVLLVDEVSMADAQMIDQASWLCAQARGADKPFGGLQFIAVGDFAQLPPVDDRMGWACDAAAWKALDPVVVNLTTPRRQTDRVFADLLARIRMGELAPRDQGTLLSRVNAFDPAGVVRILSTNAECDQVNHAELMKLPGPTRVRAAEQDGPEAILRDLDRGCPSPLKLKLRVGARVLITTNDPLAPPMFGNGTAATVREIGVAVLDPGGQEHRGVLVETDSGVQVTLPPQRWEVREWRDGQEHVVAWREQIPLRLGYAITAHRAQGATLDRVSVNLTRAFSPGQSYVALSRVRTLEGLNLESSKCGNLSAHPRFLEFERSRKPWGGLVA